MTVTEACLTAGLLFLLPAGAIHADQNDPRLNDLFLVIQQTENATVASNAESKIWEIWLEHDDQQTQERLGEGIVAMDGNPREALSIFNELVEEVPDFAEGWNKRATLYYLFRDYAASERDIEKTLALEPRHFGALSGLGLVYLAQSQYAKAISAFEAVLFIHPHSRGARQNIELINAYFRRNAI